MLALIFICLACLCGAVAIVLLSNKVDKLEDLIYANMENLHYKAVQHEFDSVWNVLKEMNPELNDDEGDED